MLTSEQRLCRLAQEAADAQDPMRALETLVELGDELEVFTRAQVGRGLRDGRSFGDVARALGISRQAAHSRYRDLAAGPPSQSGQLVATEQALRVFRVAREEALTAKATAVGSEHVLIAVLRCGGDAARALVREGVTLETARACARGLAADRGRAAGAGRRRAGPRGVLRAAKRVTIARGERSLDVDAVLLGALADPHGGARRVLTVLAADVASIRRQLGGEPDAPSTPLDPRQRTKRAMAMSDKSPPYRPFAISVVQSRDEVAVIAVGELDLASAERLGQAVREVWAAGSTHIVLDLRQVDFIDSTGLRMLLSLRNDAKRNEHALTLDPPTPTARRIFEITGTRGLFDWRIDRAER